MSAFVSQLRERQEETLLLHLPCQDELLVNQHPWRKHQGLFLLYLFADSV